MIDYLFMVSLLSECYPQDEARVDSAESPSRLASPRFFHSSRSMSPLQHMSVSGKQTDAGVLGHSTVKVLLAHDSARSRCTRILAQAVHV